METNVVVKLLPCSPTRHYTLKFLTGSLFVSTLRPCSKALFRNNGVNELHWRTLNKDQTSMRKQNKRLRRI